MRRMHVITIWNTTRPRVTRPTPWPLPPRPPSLSTVTVLARDAIHAGSSPDTTAATSVAPTVNARTGASIWNAIHEGGGFSRFRNAADNMSVAQ